jgi:hypothetical protein
MHYSIKKTILVNLILNFYLVFHAQSQNLIVTLKNSSTKYYPISGIQSIKFSSSTMILKETDQTLTTWNISDIDHYAFDMTTNILNTTNNQNSLSLYPSPATDLVKIEYQTNGASNISISIFDAQGREIEKIFSGVHHVNKIYEWNSKNYNGTF